MPDIPEDALSAELPASDGASSALVAELSWDAVGRRLAAGAIALLPVGAGAKEHGWHLPMASDQIQAEWLAGVIAEFFTARGIDILVWPTLTYGYYPAFTAYAGSISLSADLFTAMVRDIADQIHEHGARHVFVLDTGISTIRPIAEALSAREFATHLRIHDGPAYCETAMRLAEQSHGSHADEMETSRMLVIAPAMVAMTRAAASPNLADGAKRGPLSPGDPASPNYSPSGSFGDPTLATPEKGEALITAMLDDICKAIGKFAEK